MKKVAVIAVIALVVIGCVVVAGCTDQKPADKTPGDITPAVSIDVRAEGTSYNVGDIAEIILPSNPTNGYSWSCVKSDEGLDVKMDYEEDEYTDGRVGAGGQERIWLSSEKAGTYKFTLKYLKSGEGEDSAAATYNGSITFVNNPEAVGIDGPRTSYTFDSSYINPKAGEYFKISVPGNATTGYVWTASGNNLTIVDDYVVDEHEEGMEGVGGVSNFYVTAANPGTYTFKAQYGRSWESSPITSFEITLTFL